MPRTVAISDEAADRVLAHAATLQCSLGHAASALILDGSSAPGAPLTLDAAAIVLLQHLPPQHVELIRELCVENERRPVDYLLSYVRLAFERGETAVHIGDDTMVEAASGAVAAAIPPAASARCAHCGTEFVPARRGQQFCTDAHGREASLGMIRQQRAAYLQRTRPERASVNAVAAPRPSEA